MKLQAEVFFSEEWAEPAPQEPKDFDFSAASTCEAMAWIYPLAQA